jgi:hypothetical protein
MWLLAMYNRRTWKLSFSLFILESDWFKSFMPAGLSTALLVSNEQHQTRYMFTDERLCNHG